jgi:hypothetical protein
MDFLYMGDHPADVGQTHAFGICHVLEIDDPGPFFVYISVQQAEEA